MVETCRLVSFYRVLWEDIATELTIRKYKVWLKVKQFNKVMKWIYEMGLSTIHPLNFYPQLEESITILFTIDKLYFTYYIIYYKIFSLEKYLKKYYI